MYLWKWIGIIVFFMGFWKSRSECIQILTDVITSGGRKSIEQSYLYLNVNPNASHTEGFELVPSRAAQIMKKSVTQCLHCTNDSWHFVFLFLHTDEEAAWLSSREWTASCQRCREGKGVEEQMCVYGGGPFDYGPVKIHVVCSAWLMTSSLSVTTNIWLQLKWNPSALWVWHRGRSSLRSIRAIWN